MITMHQQTPSSVLNLSGLAFDEANAELLVTGSLRLHDVVHTATGTFEPGRVFVHPDGTLSTAAQGAFAHVAWHDGAAWHVIQHPAPEGSPDAEA